MKYAEVAVNAPVAGPRTFTYSVSPRHFISTGCAVWVPFGPRVLQGVVFGLTDQSPCDNTREIIDVIGSGPLLSEAQIELAKWIAEYYLAPYFETAYMMLPPAFERKTLTFVELLPDAPRKAPDNLIPHQKKMFNFLLKNGRVDSRQFKNRIPQKHILPTIKQLEKKGLVQKTSELQRERLKPKEVLFVRLDMNADAVANETALLEKKAFRQAELLKILVEEGNALPLAGLAKRMGSASPAANALQKKGFVKIEKVEVRRDPLAHRSFTPAIPPELTTAQRTAWEQIRDGLQTSSQVFMLHGVTGSGKTEIYLRALEETIALGKKGIVLVPEISLTPQTIERFASRFSKRVAVLHSRLSPGEQYDEWHRIRAGEFDVVIGSRGAVFAPQPDLGLIVIDEEHEWTYKQHEKTPLYHARDVALKLAKLVGAVVVLGSATPDLGSYHLAQRDDYRLLELPERVCAVEGGFVPSLPRIEVVDLRYELKTGNRSIFSRSLARAIDGALDAGEQVILFLNRRGTASMVQCRDCGYVMTCRSCDVPLSHHEHEAYLICHLCNYRIPPPKACPECGSLRIKFLGIGTQKVEAETAKEFPQAKVIRWDRDVTRGKHSHEEILRTFQSHEADIMVGTQMVAKGLDIPLVTVVGVISADVGLHLPDFRASERTYQLLSQVTGRAGRGILGGQAFIQTYTPDHYAIEAAAEQDFHQFYETEISLRQKYGYPPLSRMVNMIYTHTNNGRCEDETLRMVQLLRAERDSQGLANFTVTGPTPAFTPRIRGRYRWQVIIRGLYPMAVIARVPIPHGWTVDVDPVGLT